MKTETHQRRRPHTVILAAVGVVVLLAGCSLHNPHPSGSFERGAYYAERGNNVEAVAALESFVRHNPTDSLAAEAQYIKGLTYMKMAEYPLAGVEFQILRKDYPTSPWVEDAFFQEGMCYFHQVGRVERDMTGAYEARLHFLDFLDQYPNSKYVPEVHATMQEIVDLMARKRLEQAKVYRQLGRHEAVAIILDDVIVNESGCSMMARVLWERARTAVKLEDIDTAIVMYEQLLDQHPETKWGGKAAAALRALDEDEAEPDDEG